MAQIDLDLLRHASCLPLEKNGENILLGEEFDIPDSLLPHCSPALPRYVPALDTAPTRKFLRIMDELPIVTWRECGRDVGSLLKPGTLLST